jgi:N-acetyl sugar amidotransferase
VRYCRRCILPDTRPNLTLDSNGICNACAGHASRPSIDWAAREVAFRKVVANAKSRSNGYDCLIPVSGGKDSTWQVVTCLEYGLRPLAVSWKTPGRTELGAANLANLISLGVDHIDYQIDPHVERKFMYRALVQYGTTAIPMHMALFSIPLTLAARLRIPLVVWGENSAFEYGGPEDERQGFKLDARWLRRYGVTHGTTVNEWVSDGLTERDLVAYRTPSDAELDAAGVLAVFLGYYFPWDPESTLTVALAHGFRTREQGPKTGYYDYADIDDDFISVHHYLKWYKFGFTRSYDNLAIEIRNGRITREDAIAWLRARGEECPREDIDRLCAFIGIDSNNFFQVVERFRNPNIWVRRNGRWAIDGFLIPDWHWT